MKSLSVLLLFTFAFSAIGHSQDLTDQDALRTLNNLIEKSDEAAGFHSLDMLGVKKISQTDAVYADDNCIHFTMILKEYDDKPDETEPFCYEHSDIKKLVIRKVDKVDFRGILVGEFQVLLHYKQFGRFIVVGVSPDNVDLFVETTRLLAPSLKKVKYAK